MDLRGVPLDELRRRYGSRGRAPGPSTIEALLRDPREGARALAERLARRREAGLREGVRLRRLWALEDRLYRAGALRVAGVDEVGMGPLAGPVVAAAVVLPRGTRIGGLDDSKRLCPAERERLDVEIRRVARGVGIGWAMPEEIDRVNIFRAGLHAMRRAIEALPDPPDRVVVDGRRIPGLEAVQHAVPGGDRRVAAVAAASVVAKVHRDAWMRRIDREHPGYGFGTNAGYATPEHLAVLRARGPTPLHRMSYAPVRNAGPRRL